MNPFDLCQQLMKHNIQQGSEPGGWVLADFDLLLCITTTLREIGVDASRQGMDIVGVDGQGQWNLMAIEVDGNILGVQRERTWEAIEANARRENPIPSTWKIRRASYPIPSSQDREDMALIERCSPALFRDMRNWMEKEKACAQSHLLNQHTSVGRAISTGGARL
jgi:hypothetical protein